MASKYHRDRMHDNAALFVAWGDWLASKGEPDRAQVFYDLYEAIRDGLRGVMVFDENRVRAEAAAKLEEIERNPDMQLPLSEEGPEGQAL